MRFSSSISIFLLSSLRTNPICGETVRMERLRLSLSLPFPYGYFILFNLELYIKLRYEGSKASFGGYTYNQQKLLFMEAIKEFVLALLFLRRNEMD